jgi:cytochrome c553
MNCDTIEVTADDEWNFPVDANAEFQPSTSTHSLGIDAVIWGSGNFTDTPSAGDESTTLACTSCHDPHNYGQTYRMLKKQPVDSSIDFRGSTNFVFVTDQLAYARWNPGTGILAYDTTDYTDVDYASPDVYDDSGNLVEVTYEGGDPMTKYSQQMSNWCASCHERYHAEKEGHSGTGSTDSDDAIFAFRHKTGDAMINGTETDSCGYNGAGCHGGPDWVNANKQLSCLGCHVAHGTGSEMTTYAQVAFPGEDNPDLEGVPSPAVDPDLPEAWDDEWDTRSSLLRLDNRGVCQNSYCHPQGTGHYLEGHTQGDD